MPQAPHGQKSSQDVIRHRIMSQELIGCCCSVAEAAGCSVGGLLVAWGLQVVGAVFGGLARFGGSEAALGAVLGRSWLLLAALGWLLGRLGALWAALGPLLAALGPLLAVLGPLLARSWPLLHWMRWTLQVSSAG